MQQTSVQKTADITGVFLSQLCLVHCLLLPVVVSLLPSLTIAGIFHHEAFHLGSLLLATPVVLFALLQGYRTHGSTKPGVFGMAALVFLWVVFALEHSLPHDLVAAFNVMGGLLMAGAHWQNWCLTKTAGCTVRH